MSSSGGPAAEFLADPCGFFSMSYTELHSVPRERLAELQRAGLAARFEQHAAEIPMVGVLAERQGIRSVEGVEDVVPLLFEHTMYKSYPPILLERRDFRSLTRWIDKLTATDLSGVDASGCDSIDSWLELLLVEAGLDSMFSSGTSGTMSFLPWSVRDLEVRAGTRRVCDLQTFGESPEKTLSEPYHYATYFNRSRRDYVGPVMSLGREGWSRVFEPNGQSADLLWLGTRLRVAAARGDASRVEVPPSLLARRGELEGLLASEERRKEAWIDSLLALEGQRVFWSEQAYTIYEISRERVSRGSSCAFADGSMMSSGGGAKGGLLPEDWLNTVSAFVSMPVRLIYGMSEVAAYHKRCASGRYHVAPWVVPILLDPETSKPLPRRGIQRGRAAFFDLLVESHWGGVISGDEIEIDFDRPCDCGATTVHIGPTIERLSEKRGGDDKITCAAAPAAHAEAMQYLTTL
jgi:hypothetical protein